MTKRLFICAAVLAVLAAAIGCAAGFRQQRDLSRPMVAIAMSKIQENDIQAALIELRKAVSANPSDPEVYYAYAMAYWKSEKYDKALENIDKAIEYAPKLDIEHPGLASEA